MTEEYPTTDAAAQLRADLSPDALKRIGGAMYIQFVRGGSGWQAIERIGARLPEVPVAALTRFLDGLVEHGYATRKGKPGQQSYRLVL